MREERTYFLSELTPAVGGEVLLDRRDHTARIRLFAGGKALHTRASTAMLDTGSPASCINQKVWQEMLACGSGSEDGSTEVPPKTWGGFYGAPLITFSYVRLNIQLENIRGEKSVRFPTVYLVVFAYVVPDKGINVDLLLRRDSWSHFP